MNDNKKLSEWIEIHLELKGKSGESAEVAGADLSDMPEAEGMLPPRSTLFPSNRKKLTKMFYNSLFIVFVMLVIGLTVWGAKLK